MQPALSVEIAVLAITILINLLLALIVYKNNPKSKTTLIFVLLSIITSEWLIVNYVALHPSIHPASLTWSRFSIFFAVPQIVLFFLLANTMPYEKLQISTKKLLILLTLAIGIMILTISPYAFIQATVAGNTVHLVPGWGMGPFVSFAIIISISAIYILWKRIKISNGIEREQLRFVLAGIVAMITLIITTILIPIVLFRSTIFVSFTPLYDLVFLGATTYAIVRHRLMDIRMLVTRTVAYSIFILLVSIIYTLLVGYIGRIFFKSPISNEHLIFSVAVTVIVTFSFLPIRNAIERLTDKLFYKNLKSTQIILKNLSKATSSSIDINTLTNSILNTIVEELRLTHGAIIILSKDNQKKISYIYQNGYDKPIDITDNDVQFLSESAETIVFDEIPEGTKKDLLRHFKIAVSIPLTSHGEQIGLAIFGEKSSGSIYTDEEINLLEIFAPEAAIAIQNALSYEEIIRFNTNLQKEVQKATEDMKSITEDVYKKNIELNHVKTQLEEANAKLKELDHLKDEFVSLASHELRTPMTAIKSYLWMFLQYNSTTLDPKERQYIERAYEATDRLITLVNDMLNVSRIESGRMNILFMPVDLPKLAKEVTEELTPTALKQNVFFKIDSPNDLPEVTGDQNKIREVLTNLVGNSLKFSNPGGTITIKMTQTDDFIKTEVIDTGKGIKQEDLPKLFHKFGIVGNNYLQKTNSQGTGLGLYICKSIIELHGGNIYVKSEGENKGTTFSFTLKINHETKTETKP